VSLKLPPPHAVLEVETRPAGLSLELNGKPAGKGPARVEAAPGAADLVIADPCWRRTGVRLALKAGDTRQIRLEGEQRLGGLKVKAEDDSGNAREARVLVDGKEVGVSGAVLQVPVCAREVEARAGSLTWKGRLELQEGAVKTLSAVLRRGGGCPADMVALPAGTLVRSGLDVPVEVRSFCVDLTEVTAAEYERCVRDRKCPRPDTGGRCNFGRSDRAGHPVNCVDLLQAKAYCSWAGKRLPRWWEWEWAAQGAQRGTRYPWGGEAPDGQLCWSGTPDTSLPEMNPWSTQPSFRTRDRDGTCPAGSHAAGDSPHGVKDLAGNVAEWNDPGIAGEEAQVRGGSWKSSSASSVLAVQSELELRDHQGSEVGFRCVKEPHASAGASQESGSGARAEPAKAAPAP
jgi:hypothetical protein